MLPILEDIHQTPVMRSLVVGSKHTRETESARKKTKTHTSLCGIAQHKNGSPSWHKIVCFDRCDRVTKNGFSKRVTRTRFCDRQRRSFWHKIYQNFWQILGTPGGTPQSCFRTPKKCKKSGEKNPKKPAKFSHAFPTYFFRKICPKTNVNNIYRKGQNFHQKWVPIGVPPWTKKSSEKLIT